MTQHLMIKEHLYSLLKDELICDVNCVHSIKVLNGFWMDKSEDYYDLWDGVVLEIYLDHKFQWPQEGLNC